MKCFYHSADLDGHCSGAIIKLRHLDCEMIGINYGDAFPWETIKEGEEVFMVDFSLQPFDDMERLNKMCNLHWIDHHKTAIDEAHERGFIASGSQLVEVGKAGCELVWGCTFSDDVPESVRLLGRYDVWDHTDVKTLPFQYGMRQVKETIPDGLENMEFWDHVFFSEGFVGATVHTGQFIMDYESSQNAKFCKAYAFETELIGFSAICANRGFTNSKLFDSVYKPEEHDLMITFVRKKLPAEVWAVSLYSTKEDVDCGFIAKRFGGGGHKGAAGFQCKELPFKV